MFVVYFQRFNIRKWQGYIYFHLVILFTLSYFPCHVSLVLCYVARVLCLLSLPPHRENTLVNFWAGGKVGSRGRTPSKDSALPCIPGNTPGRSILCMGEEVAVALSFSSSGLVQKAERAYLGGSVSRLISRLFNTRHFVDFSPTVAKKRTGSLCNPVAAAAN